MSEKRKPSITIVATRRGKKSIRVELFPVRLWPKKFGYRNSTYSRYRVRLNRKWASKDNASWTLTDVLRQMRGWLAKSR